MAGRRRSPTFAPDRRCARLGRDLSEQFDIGDWDAGATAWRRGEDDLTVANADLEDPVPSDGVEDWDVPCDPLCRHEDLLIRT
jgi:hypothetical protein